MTSLHPALVALRRYTEMIPGVWPALEANRIRHGYTPASDPVGQDFLNTIAGLTGRPANWDDWSPLHQQQIVVYAALAAWRYTLGIYRFDPSVYDAVCSTALDGDIPVEILQRLPEWVVYIETPGLSVSTSSGTPEAILGAWVRVAGDAARPTLCIYTHSSSSPDFIDVTQIGLSGGSLRDACDEAARQTARKTHSAKLVGSADHVRPIVNLVLYLCSQAAEITGKRGRPGNPAPTRTRRGGERLFAADGPATWEVGTRLGAALRLAYHDQETGRDGEHTGPAPHIRRAHWHGFRLGARKTAEGVAIPAEKRKFELRWLPPIPVNLTDYDQLQATIRPVG